MSYNLHRNESSLTYNNSTLSPILNAFRIELKKYVANVNDIISFVQASICIMGIFGNILALIVINQKFLRNTSSSVFITYLAIFDSAVLILHGANLARPSHNPLLHCFLIYFTELTTCCANWILVIITLERCIAVYSPLHAKRLCTVASARNSIYTLLIASTILFTTTFPFIYHIDGHLNHPKCRVRPNFRLALRVYQSILLYFIPDIFLLSNLLTVYSLCQRRHRLSTAYSKREDTIKIRINDVNSNRKQRQLTIMLVTVSLSFYLFTTPANIIFIMEFHPYKHREINKIKRFFLLSQISVVLLQLNNATNFIFYCFAGQRFRKATWQTLYHYSVKIKTFYHRYILCDKEYSLTPIYQPHITQMANITATNRSSCIPYPLQYQKHGRLTV